MTVSLVHADFWGWGAGAGDASVVRVGVCDLLRLADVELAEADAVDGGGYEVDEEYSQDYGWPGEDGGSIDRIFPAWYQEVTGNDPQEACEEARRSGRIARS